MANPVVHFQIMGTDAPALRKFYEQAFAWEFSPVGGPVDYSLVENAGIGGGIGQCPEGKGSVTFYVAVDDIHAAMRKVESLGAKIVDGPWPLPTGGQIAQFVDPQGQSIGLVQN